IRSTNTNTISGVISEQAGGHIVFSQFGTGTTILTGANTFTGSTSVFAGRLVVDGHLASNLVGVSVGTLAETGTIVGKVTVSGGTLSPGNALVRGPLTVGAFVLDAGATTT